MFKVTVILKGGLGNQMFQYAFGKALAKKNGALLILDTVSGFKRDKVYKRKYALDKLNLPATVKLTRTINIVYLYELLLERSGRLVKQMVNRRFYGSYIKETSFSFPPLEDLADTNHSILIDGFWQNEKYFDQVQNEVKADFSLGENAFPHLTTVAEKLSADNAIAICIRHFEEMPGSTKSGVGGLTSLAFYEDAAAVLSKGIGDVKYYVFSTTAGLLKERLRLNGTIEYLTADEGYDNETETLWLLTHCKKQVIANSSFYWWGAWLAEKKNSYTKIIASKLFANPASVPARWRTEWVNIHQ